MLNAHQDLEKMEEVDIIASGYEWICPNCDNIQYEIEVTDVVECKECQHLYKTSIPEHAHA